MDTQELIAQLSREAPLTSTPRPPAYFAACLLGLMLAFGAVVQTCLGLRSDLLAQLTRPMFVLEVALLLVLTVVSTVAAMMAMYPDAYQRTGWLKLPFWTIALLVALLLFQLLMPHDPRMVIPPPGGHALKCAVCIASTAIIPAALIFALLRKGASVHPLKAGSFAVLAAWGLGCLTLRLSESNDALAHLLTWHYLPTLLFAALGTLAGRYLLRW